MKIWVVLCLVLCNALMAAPKKPRPQPVAATNNYTGSDADDLSDKEIVKAILPHLALVVKSFFIIVQEHQNFNSVVTNIGQMIMSFFTIGSYMLRSPEMSLHDTSRTTRCVRDNYNAMLACLAHQYSKVLATQACS